MPFCSNNGFADLHLFVCVFISSIFTFTPGNSQVQLAVNLTSLSLQFLSVLIWRHLYNPDCSHVVGWFNDHINKHLYVFFFIRYVASNQTGEQVSINILHFFNFKIIQLCSPCQDETLCGAQWVKNWLEPSKFWKTWGALWFIQMN